MKLGQIVLYGGYNEQAAVVTKVWAPGCVNLHVFKGDPYNTLEPSGDITSVQVAAGPQQGLPVCWEAE